VYDWTKRAVRRAEEELEAAREAGASDEEIARLEEELGRREEKRDAAAARYRRERRATTALVGELSDEQVFAMNRALNNTLASHLIVNIDARQLQQVVDGDYDERQINAFTQAFEQEARFRSKAWHFAKLYDETSDEKFREKAERFNAKASDQKQKFLGKIDRFGGDVGHDAAHDSARASARSAAKRAAHDEARRAARDTAREAAKKVARTEVKGRARQAVRAEVRKAVKQESKRAAKKAAKGGGRP
jgi:hypothetical protein